MVEEGLKLAGANDRWRCPIFWRVSVIKVTVTPPGSRLKCSRPLWTRIAYCEKAPGSIARAITMKRVTFDLPHDEHVRDFRMFVADTAARRRLLGAPARQRVYANRRLLVALV
jgi:hypothetical protein